MSYGVHAYAIDLGAVKKAIGCGDVLLAKRLARTYARELASIDGIDFDEGLAPAADCLAALISVGGASGDDTPGYKFGYTLEILCRSLGEALPSRTFSGMGSELFDTLDAALKKAKTKRRVSSFLFRGSPVPLPEIEDFPAIGWLAPEEIADWRADLSALLGAPAKPAKKTSARSAKSASPAFSGRVEGTTLVVNAAGKKTLTSFPTNKAAQQALITALRSSNNGAVGDEALDGLRELLAWFDAAAAKKLGIVTFYY